MTRRNRGCAVYDVCVTVRIEVSDDEEPTPTSEAVASVVLAVAGPTARVLGAGSVSVVRVAAASSSLN